MVASGPFALGPAMASSSSRRAAPRSNFAPLAPLGSSSSSLGAGLTQSTAPSLKREPRDSDQKIIDVDAYSDPDDGVEIVDMDDVRRMDWMAPESLRKEKVTNKKKKKAGVKKEEGPKGKVKGESDAGSIVYIVGLDHGFTLAEPEDVDLTAEEEEQVDLANALDLSDSEEEEELEDIINDFALQEEDLDSVHL